MSTFYNKKMDLYGIKRIVTTKVTEDFKDGHLVHRKTEKKEYVPKKGTE